MKVNFKTNILLKDIIGKGLINDDNLAIIELVKNSFDAKASKVDVIFKYLTSKTKTDLFDNTKTELKKSTIIIKDDGDGMNENDIKEKWLNIAYSEKRDKSDITSHVFAGDKGVGRFSCDRLGKYLNLYTKKAGQPIYHLKIDWTQFEKGKIDTTIQSVNVELNEISEFELKNNGHKIGNKGTILEIIDLRADWTKIKIKDLKIKYLAKLINPNQQYVKNNINLYLEAFDYEISEKVENLVFKNLAFRTTSIEAVTNYNESTKELIITTVLKHKGQNILTITEKNNRFKNLKNVKIFIYYLNSYSKVRFHKEAGERIKDYGSIFLFLNGFRVSPYGEKDNDWLGLEMRRSQGQKRFFSARDIVGRIEITDFEGYFKPVSSREGLVRNATYDLLVNKDAIKDGYNEDNDKTEYGLFYQVLTALEKYVVDGLAWDSPVSSKYIGEFEEDTMGEKDLIDELYAETDSEKDKRSLDAVQSILRTRKGEILDVKINTDLVIHLLEEDADKTKKVLKTLNKYQTKMDEETLVYLYKIEKVLKDKEEEIKKQKEQLTKEELQRLEAQKKAEIEKKKREQAEEKAAKAEQKAKDEELKRKDAQLKAEAERQKAKQAELEAEAERQKKKAAELRAEEERQKAKQAQQEADKANAALNVEKLKAEFYKKQSSPDTDALIHHVKNNNEKIKTAISNIIMDIQDNRLDTNELIQTLYRMLQYTEKTLKATDLILQSDLEKADAQEIDLPSFIDGYIHNSPILGKKISISTKNNNKNFKIIASKLDLALILDNLIDNSIKWEAKNIFIEVIAENSKCVVLFSDDGLGLSKKYLDNPDKIFSFKETDREGGTGFGLYLVRDALSKMRATIAVDNNHKENGIQFKIIFL